MSKTILIVDDSDMIRRVLSFKLKSEGYTVLTGEDGNDALKFFDGKDIDLMITDLNMPEKDGIQLIHEVRTMQYYKFLPVMLFLSDPSVNVKEFINTSGATILFDKSSIKEKLLPIVKRLVS